MAWSGAPTRGPLRSSDRSAWATGRPSATSVSRRAPPKVFSASGSSPSAASFSRAMRSRSRAAFACMRAGISSESSSSSNWGIYSASLRTGEALSPFLLEGGRVGDGGVATASG